MKILATGFYHRNNLGDDIYPELIRRHLATPVISSEIRVAGDQCVLEHTDHLATDITFVSIDDLQSVTHYDAIVVGGGDLLNQYFHDKLSRVLKDFKGPVIGISFGIPFPSMIQEKTLSHFTHMFTRNLEDIDSIRRVMGSTKCHFMPDLAFGLMPVQPRTPALYHGKPRCGVYLVQNMIQYKFFMKDMLKLLTEVGKTHHLDFFLFNTSVNASENDSIISLKLASKLSGTSVKVWNRQLSWEKMLHHMSKMDVGICMRYHSHIFSMVAGLPMMSISSTRKTRSLMTQAHLSDYQYHITLNDYGTPVASDSAKMIAIWKALLSDSPSSAEFVDRCRMDLDNTLIRQLMYNACVSNSLCNDRPRLVDTIVHEIQSSTASNLLAGQLVGYRSLQALGGNPYPDTPYVWGFSEQYKEHPEKLKSMVDYVVGEYQSQLSDVSVLSTVKSCVKDVWNLVSSPTHKKIYVNPHDYISFKSVHRAGWWNVVEELAKVSSENGIYCDLYVDRTFLWCNEFYRHTGSIPYTHEWIGFIHHTPNTEYSDNNVVELLKCKEFQQSLYTCRGIYVLSEYLARYLRERLDVRVIVLTHPTEIPSEKFSSPRFNKLKLVAVGAWMRDPLAIYAVTSNIPKVVLYGTDMKDYIPPPDLRVVHGTGASIKTTVPWCHGPCRPYVSSHRWTEAFIQWLYRVKRIEGVWYQQDTSTLYVLDDKLVNEIFGYVKTMNNSVYVQPRLSDSEYDTLLNRSIVLLQLVDCSAVNTLIECIARNTPLVVNKHPAVVELLGEGYPMYYDYRTMGELKFTQQWVLDTTRYLSKLDKSRITMDTFVKEFTDSILC